MGNLFLPVTMTYDPDRDPPSRGQWATIHALYFGQLFAPDDSLIIGTMNMLDDHSVQDLTLDVGWLKGGVWPIFDAHRALAHNWMGEADRAEQLLYAFANHSTPTLLWGEEQSPKGKGTRVTGDVPHTVGNMQIVRLARYLLMLERDDELELLAGLPLSWIYPGAHLEVKDLPTIWGRTSIRIDVDKAGTKAELSIRTSVTRKEGRIVLHLDRLKKTGYTHDRDGQPLPEEIELDWGQEYRIEVYPGK